ncbi:MAG: hypothetical protein U1F22_13870 [Lysobacterales bacterium]
MTIKQAIVAARTLAMVSGVAALGAVGSVAAATSIRWINEDVATGTFSVTNQVSTITTTTPFLCGSLGTPGNTFANKINAVFPGANAGQGSFLFGALNAGAQVPVPGLGAWTFSPTSGMVIASSDPTLVCYALDANGVRKMTADLFLDNFEQPSPDASIAIRVAQLPNAGNFYSYKYFIDVTIPAVSVTKTSTFRLRDGYDSSVFNGNAYFCDVPVGVTDCPGATTSGNVDVPIPLPANNAYSRRFIVHRQIPNTGSLPGGKPLVLAALFGPGGIETRLDNNVAQGYNQISDLAPTVSTSGTDLSGIAEGQSKLGVSFTVSDDTAEQAGQLLGANVSISYNGTVVSGPADCTSISGSAPKPAPVTRTCTFDVVSPSANFATDGATAGTYAPGVSASVSITATDRLGQSSQVSVLPLHVASGDNDAPTATLSAVAVPDDNNNGMPTLSCSLATITGETPDPGCTGIFGTFLAGIAAAPSDAVDELATQTAAVALGSNNNGHPGYKFLSGCTLDSGSANIFAPNGQPSFLGAGSGSYDLGYWINGINTGSATCAISVTDAAAGGFPAGQSAQTTTKSFRIVVTN